MATRDVFSADELAQLRGFPEIGRAELIRFFMLTPADEEFVRRFRDRRNLLGAAVQLCTLPWLGFVPEAVPSAPAAAVARLSERLAIPVGELRGYGAREQTHSDHLRDVAAYLGWRQVDRPHWKDLEEFLFARAMGHDSPKLLFRLACEYLSSSRLVRPGVVLVLERVAAARKRARKETWQRVEPMLTGFLRRAGRDARARPAAGPYPAGLAGDRAGVVDAGGGEGRAGEAGVPARDGRAHAGPVGPAGRAPPVPRRAGAGG